MRLRTLPVTVLMALLLAPVTVFAQQVSEGPDTYLAGYYNFNFGGDLFKDRDEDTTTNGFGGALTFWGRGKFSAEIDFNYNKNFFGKSDVAGDNNLLTFTLGGIVGPWAKAGSGRVRPYFAFGGGLMRSTVEEFATVGWQETKNLGLLEAGGGLLWLFNDTLGMRADVRYRWGVGADADEDGWGLIEKWTYVRATVGIALAF
jgi:hypothetical protein